MRFLDHTQLDIHTHTHTLGRNLMIEWSARRRGRYIINPYYCRIPWHALPRSRVIHLHSHLNSMLCSVVLGIQHNSKVPAHCRMPCVRIWTVQMMKLSTNLCLCSRHFNKRIIEIKLKIFSTSELEGKNDQPQVPAALSCGPGVHRIKLRSRAGQGGM